MKTIIRTAIATAIGTAALLSIGCAGMPGMPGALPSGLPTAGGSASDPATVGAACTAEKPAATPDTGAAGLGKYAGQLIPATWNNAYKTEAEVTAAFDAEKAKLPGGNWVCMNKFYNGAIKMYNIIKNIV